MAKYKLRLNLNTGGTVTTNAIDLPAKVVSAEFVEVAPARVRITLLDAPKETGTTPDPYWDVDPGTTWGDLIGVQSTNVSNYTIASYNTTGVKVRVSGWPAMGTCQIFADQAHQTAILATDIISTTSNYYVDQ